VNVLRFLRPDCIRLPLNSRPMPLPEEPDEETEAQRRKRLNAEKEQVMEEIALLMDHSGEVVNPTKFHKDLIFHERRNTTAIHPGVALPHVRSQQIRAFVMGFARADGDGLWYDSLDKQPTRFFFMLAAPPWDDRTYLHVYRELALVIQDEDCMLALGQAETAQDVFNALRTFFR